MINTLVDPPWGVANNPNLVGSAWIISSAILTTFSTTSFLKSGSEASPLPSPTKQNRDLSSQTVSMKTKDEDSVLLPSKSKMSRPALLTLYRFSGSLLLGLFANPNIWGIGARARTMIALLPSFALPAGFLFVANFSNSIALSRIGISLTYTSKCGIPLITVLLMFLLEGSSALPSIWVLLTLVPIAAGIAAASWNSPSFESVGFAAAILSAISQAALNVSSKRVMKAMAVSGIEAQRAMVSVALAITVILTGINRYIFPRPLTQPMSAANLVSMSGHDVTKQPLSSSSSPQLSLHPWWLTPLAVLSYHIEYVLSFMFVALVQPITYGTCDAIRRLAIIIAGHKMFGGTPFSRLNVTGIGMALLGALGYSATSSMGK